MIETVAYTLAVLCGAGAAYRILVAGTRDRLDAWRRTAVECGLGDFRESRFPTILTGSVRGLTVRLENPVPPKSRARIQIAVERPDCHGVRLAMRREGFDTAIDKMMGDHEMVIGDISLDSNFFIVGSDIAFAAAFFDAGTRDSLVDLRDDLHRVAVEEGELRVQITAGTDAPERFARVLARVIGIGAHMPGRVELVARLAQNAANDAEPAIRENNLAFLAGEFRGHAASREALRAATRDHNVAVRLRAGVGLREEGHAVLLEITQSDAPEACVAEAVSALGARLPADLRVALFGRAVTAGQSRVVAACIPLLGRAGDDAAEARLIGALSMTDRDVQIAAAHALGRTGSALAVEPLKAIARGRGDEELSRAAGEAIAMIQDRTEGTPGQLSLSDASAGQVSLADGGAGQLSLPTSKADGRDGAD